jgi:predicted nucleic acid-binding protein
LIDEIQAGIETTREQNSAKADEIEVWLEQVAETYNILPIDGRAFRSWARLLHRRPNDLIADGMIAATAEVDKLTVVTRNVRDFERLGVQVLNAFSRGPVGSPRGGPRC